MRGDGEGSGSMGKKKQTLRMEMRMWTRWLSEHEGQVAGAPARQLEEGPRAGLEI